MVLRIPSRSGDRHEELNWRQALHEGQLGIALEPSDPKGFRWYNMWKSIVEHYTMCNLTYPTDKMAALSSVAAVFSQSFGGFYIAGLGASKSDGVPWLVDQLAWKVSGKNNKPPRRESEFCGPSWSWVSVDGAVEIISSPLRVSEHSFYAPDKEMPWVSIDLVDSGVPTGQVGKNCTFSIRGQLMNVPRMAQQPERGMPKDTNTLDHVQWQLSFDDPRDDPHEHNDAVKSNGGSEHDCNLIVLLLGLFYTQDSFPYESQHEDRSSEQQPPPKEQPQGSPQTISTPIVAKEEESKVYTMVFSTPQANEGLGQGMRKLKGYGLILKAVPDRAGYFTRIGLLKFEPLGEWNYYQVRKWFIEDETFGPDDDYDQERGHKITLI